MNEERLLDVGNKVVERSLKLGADEAEAYISWTLRRSISMYMGSIKAAESVEDFGIGLRIVKDGKIGFVYSSGRIDDVDRIVMRGISIANASKRDKNWHGFPTRGDIPKVKGTFSKDLTEVTLDEMAELMYVGMKIIEEHKDVFPVGGEISVYHVKRAIVNSNGVELGDNGTYAISYLEVVARREGYTTPVSFDIVHERTRLPDIEELAKAVCKKALESLKPIKAERGVMPVVLSPLALEELMTYTFYESISAENIYRGRSYYVGKLGERICSEHISIIDDGLIDRGFFTAPFDDEGVAHKETVIVEKGILKSYISDSYYGNLIGGGSTGNALRTRSYRALPTIHPTNIILKMPSADLDDIINDIKQGLLVEHIEGAHSSNPESGEFSIVAAPAWAIYNGKIRAVRGAMLSGNFYELMNKIELMSKNIKQVNHLIAGYIMFNDVHVIA